MRCLFIPHFFLILILSMPMSYFLWQKNLPTFLFMPMQCLLLCCCYTYIIGKSNNNNITIRQINIWWFFNLTLFILWFAFEALLMYSWMRHSIPPFCVHIYVLIYFWCENILQIKEKWMKMHGTKEWKKNFSSCSNVAQTTHFLCAVLGIKKGEYTKE